MNAAEFKAARERMGLSGAELGKRLGVTGAAVSRYESGKRPISKLVTNAVINLEAAMRATGQMPQEEPKTGKSRPKRSK